ncbi:DNA-binding MarR family transcriptional regulator [Saccharothrix tamanrassetensis]|uniref:DNA-binding MarR family transcriptional regulator n=1 Tax=Saccharothrix tamanrassetensis TaxID=1051531 RepID=A0A841CPL2_9PSEU|nr:MarR family winged helix-turn-helix transcriptional regulator [Saccharothrix tamanrassetensis]MBB5958078.1 DNA-binding MarR family transcriptional regulator [Saccharothrix tamanrassetensis]
MTALTDRGSEFSALLVEVFRLNGLLLAAGDELAAPAGLTSARWQVLGVVDHGPSTVAQVARTMGLTRQAVRQTANSLVGEGMLEFVDDPRDRRARLLALTPPGRTALREVERRQAEWADDVGARIPLAELRAVTGTLRDLGDLLDHR